MTYSIRILSVLAMVIAFYSFVLIHGDEKEYYPSGKLMRERKHYDSCSCDSTKQYHEETGTLQSQYVSKHISPLTTVFEGDYINYYPNGVISICSHYENGKLQGREYSNSPIGQLAYEHFYNNDTRTGVWKNYFSEDGSLSQEIDYTGTNKNVNDNSNYGIHKFYDHGKLTHIVTYDGKGEISKTEVIDKGGYKAYQIAHAPTGEKLFKANCSICHSKDKEIVGPPLAGVTKRRSNKWLKEWIYDSDAMKKKGDKYALEIDKKYPQANQSPMTYLKDKEIEMIIDYLKTMN